MRFLRFLENNFEKIVLLGDIWETLTPIHPGAAAEELKVCREAHIKIAERFLLPQYTYVHGNHDIIAGPLENVPEAVSFDTGTLATGRTRILFAHGHQHDLLFRHAKWAAEALIWLGGWLRRLGMTSLYRMFDRIDSWRSGHELDPLRCTFQKWAVQTARLHRSDVIVTGHTHIPTRAEHGDRLFLNIGSCAEGRFSFLSMNTAKGLYQVESAW